MDGDGEGGGGGGGTPLQHAKALGVRDGLEQSLRQLVLVAIVGKQQHVEASVRGWQPAPATHTHTHKDTQQHKSRPGSACYYCTTTCPPTGSIHSV